MLKFRRILSILIYLSMLGVAITANAEEEIEDLIDIFESEGKIIAVIEGQKTVSFGLRPKEKILWSGSKGNLGTFITNYRFFVISSSTNAWKILALKSNEPENGVASLSPNIALLVTGVRAICFDAASNRFVEVQLPIHDELIVAEAEKNVAVVLTSSRLFGFASETQAFNEFQLRVRESIDTIKISSNKATVRTSERLLTFEATGSTWTEHRL